MEGHALVSPDVLGAYAADAAREVQGVRGLVEGGLPRHRGVKVAVGEGGAVRLELRIALTWDSGVAEACRQVQDRVAGYLATMAEVRPEAVDVLVAEIAAPAAPG
jgi:uncharacterized alkaline shock family protein YloU